ncbi:hypothetical protein ROA7745_00541 [Roseovarius aestuarii]|uniref:Uncharacterized protein n=2 Tax=Roseovarius aestuarii TaxID=475083 RepID=A0A1X7BMH2_9RHOB|nr:hypothetical protein ROA7745_00541 [Roseovarius aestuarii]
MNRTMTNSYDGFEDRLEKIDTKHAKMARGYKGTIDRDGLIVFRPVRRRAGVPVKAIVVLLIGFFVFKGMVMAHTGASIYEERVAALKNGTLIEQVGAFAMQPDPVTVGVATQLGHIFN